MRFSTYVQYISYVSYEADRIPCRILALLSAISKSRKQGPGPLSSLTAARLRRGQDSGVFRLSLGYETRDQGAA